MIDIVIGEEYESGKDITISSEDVAAVVFPCSSFEAHTLWRQLQDIWGFSNQELIQPRLGRPMLVDWCHFLGEEKEILVVPWCWNVRGVWLCFVESTGNFSSYNLIEEWIDGHFPCTWDGGTRRAVFDPFNFHNCVRALKEAIATKES